MKKSIIAVSIATFLLPALALAASFDAGTRPDTTPGINGLNKILTLIASVMGILWIFFIAFAIIMFVVAGFQFLAARGESDGVEKARKAILWGAIGVVIAVMAFAIPFFIRNTVAPAQPNIPIQNGV